MWPMHPLICFVTQGETGKDLEAPAPHIIVPTTAGAGVEISTKALILDEDEECKQSFVSMPILAEVRSDCFLGRHINRV